MRPKLLVDATAVGPEPTGIGTYAVQMVAALARLERFDLTVVAQGGTAPARWGAARVVEAPPRTGDFLGRLAWREARLPSLLARERTDVVMVPLPELPARPLPCPSVVVVHDVSILTAPSLFSRTRWLRQAVDLGRVCRRATRVVCVSETTRIQLFGAVRVDPDSLAVVGEGPGNFVDVGDAPATERDLRTVLWVGQAIRSRGRPYRHKNLEALLRAVGRDAAGTPPLELVIAGPLEAGHRHAFDRLVRSCGAEGRVRHLGYVSATALDALYRRAGVVAFPSLVEGFGLPVLEALTRGAPVVASDIPAIREVAGDAVRYVASPLDADAWRGALREVLQPDGLRDALVERGRARARAHTWDAAGELMAREILSAVA